MRSMFRHCPTSSALVTLAAAFAVASFVDHANAGVSSVLTQTSQFNPGLSTLVGCAFDPAAAAGAGVVWVYPNFDANIYAFTTAGAPLGTIPAPGGGADDVDIEVAPESLQLGRAIVPAGTLLMINGETGVAEIYGINPSTGAVIGTLITTFGVGHVVGGAYHPTRNTFFLVQDQVPGGTAANRIAEIDPITGATLNSFKTTPSFTINYGDIDIDPLTGNLLLVSNAESTVGEFTPEGTFLGETSLPPSAGGLSGIGRGTDGTCGEAWVCATNGTVTHLVGFNPPEGNPDLNADGFVDGADLGLLLGAWGDCPPQDDCCSSDLNSDKTIDGADLGLLLGAWS